MAFDGDPYDSCAGRPADSSCRLRPSIVHIISSIREWVVLFEWDDVKAASNLAKHGVSFKLAQQVWDDPLYMVIPDRVDGGERRWHAIGMVGAIVVLVVVHSHPEPDDEDHVRIISARKATAHERKRYEQESD